MAKSYGGWYWRLGLASFLSMGGAIAFSGDYAHAQITPDGTLGAESSVVTPTNVNGLPGEQIDGGATRGANLFHSFEEFSIPTGGEASFNNALDIQNIISRVTGLSISNIDGLLRANGAANLFLLNPNGIVFGPNASLSIGGSFVGTTANAIGFGTQGFFSASAPDVAPVLTVNPDVFFFNQIANAPIRNNSRAPARLSPLGINVRGLRVPDGRSLLLVGGDVSLESGGRLNALGGRVELGGLAGAGTIGLNGEGNNLSLAFPNSVERSDIFLSNGAAVDVAAGDGGSIAVNARILEMIGKSQLFAGIRRGLGSDNSKAGNIEVNTTGAINLNNESFIANQMLEKASGQGGDINISANALIVKGGAQVNASTVGGGKGGSLTVDANDVQIIGESADGQIDSALAASALPNSIGDAGDLTIKTNTLLVKDGAQVTASTGGSGKGGNLRVDASDVQLIGEGADGLSTSSLFASTESTGNAGDLSIKTNTLLVQDGAQMVTSTFGAGKGGSLTVNATEVQIIGTSNSIVFPSGFPSGLGASAEPGSTGDAGDLSINTDTLLVRDGAQVGVPTLGSGKGGNLRVDASDVQLIGTTPGGEFASGLFASALPNSTGDAGDLSIKTNTLLVQDGADVTVQGSGTGTAGNMTLNARSIRLNNNALLTANTRSARADPNREQATININSQDLIMSRNSNIFTKASGENVIGGNININSDIIAALENSDISANSANFRGGRVKITTQGIFGSQFRDTPTSKSDITATGGSPEFSGTVEINTPDVDPAQGLVELPAVPINAEVVQACTPGGSQQQSEFVVTGRGGLPPTPDDALSSDAIQVDWVTLNPEISNRSSATPSTNSTSSAPTQIVEASGWVKGPKGEITLVANAPSDTLDIPWVPSSECRAAETGS